MWHPESILRAGRKAADRFPDDIPRATRYALQLFKRLPEYEEWCEGLPMGMAQDIIHEARHHHNRDLKRQSRREEEVAVAACASSVGAATNGGSTKPRPEPRPRINVAESHGVRSTYISYMTKRIAGRIVGLLYGRDLEDIATGERARSSGHEFNARLLQRLHSVVPDDRMVQEAISDEKFAALWKDVEKGMR
jgi:plasmid stabilization system protein ParE